MLRRLDAEVYARVQAAAIHTLYGYIDYLARNILPDLADEDWLTRHGNIKRCPRKGATRANGFVRWEGVQNALSMPADTEIHRDDGQIYTTTATTPSAKGVLRVPIVAKSSGQVGNCEDGIALRLATPISGLSSTGYADSIRTGTDIEDLDSWRQRIMARWYDTPQGGADSDYVRWAKEVLGISRAWTHRHKNGIGTVGVMVASDDVDHPAPTQEILTKVREHILPLAPVAGSGLTIFPVTAKTVGLTETVDCAKNATPNQRKINGKTLTQDVQLTATDVHAVTPEVLRVEIPVGIPLPWPAERAPTGWFICNGEPFDKKKYPLLALAYPSGKLPDLRGEFIRGWDAGRGVNPRRKVLSSETASLESHAHGYRDRYYVEDDGPLGHANNKEKMPVGYNADTGSRATDGDNDSFLFIDKTTSNAGGSETRPRNVAFNYIVRAA